MMVKTTVTMYKATSQLTSTMMVKAIEALTKSITPVKSTMVKATQTPTKKTTPVKSTMVKGTKAPIKTTPV